MPFQRKLNSHEVNRVIHILIYSSSVIHSWNFFCYCCMVWNLRNPRHQKSINEICHFKKHHSSWRDPLESKNQNHEILRGIFLFLMDRFKHLIDSHIYIHSGLNLACSNRFSLCFCDSQKHFSCSFMQNVFLLFWGKPRQMK